MSDIEKITIADARQAVAVGKAIEKALGCNPSSAPASTEHPYTLGQNYLVETVTKYYLGRLSWVGSQELVLDDAAWIADTGRYNEALANGTANEVEPCPDGPTIIGRGSIVAVTRWTKALLRSVK
jgi:hypothetical protein